MRYAIVCDTRVPDLLIYVDAPVSATELITNPDTAARLLIFETNSFKELKDFCANFRLTHPEYYI